MVSEHTDPQISSRVARYFQKLSPGDKLIVGVLSFFVLCFSSIDLLVLTRSFFLKVPTYGGTLTEGIVGIPRFVNPLLAQSDADKDISSLLYAGLLKKNIEKNGSYTPVLAKAYTVSTDRKVYTFTLRTDAVFSDGTPLTSEDVLFTIKKAQDPKLKSPLLSNWAHIEVRVIDPHTIQFTLPKPYEPFLENMTIGILPSHIWREIPIEEFPFAKEMVLPIGAGPFVIQSVVRSNTGGVSEYYLSANTKYIDSRPYLDTLHFIFFPTQENLKVGFTNKTIESAYGVSGEKTLSAPYARIFAVFFNQSKNPLFENTEVRKALSVAVDRDEIIRTHLGGYGHSIYGPLPYTEILEALVNTATTSKSEQAKKILRDGGWKFDDTAGRWKKGTQELALTLTTATTPELKAVGTSIQGYWNSIGVPASIEFFNPLDLTDQVIRPRKFDALLFGESIGTNPDLYAFWSSKEKNDPGLNITGYTNKTVDTLLEQVRTEPDEAKKSALLLKIQTLITDDVPAVFTYTPDFVYRIPTDLKGVVLPSIVSPSDRFATVSSWYRKEKLVWPSTNRKK
jgi:peptide/nickel transport system substrate-binding protein